eukprot:11401616-Alexandrium_andersonii.AAC.1
MRTAGPILLQLGRRCRGGHARALLVSGRAAGAAAYPPQLCRATLRGAEAQRRLGGRPRPPA